MEKRIRYRIVFLHMVLTLPLINLVHCCDDGAGYQGDCQRFAMELSNRTAGNLNWVVGDIASMIKSPFFEDIFYLAIQNGGFYKFNITDSSHEYVTHNSAELRNIDQLIQVEKSLMLAVDESKNLVVLVSLDNTSSDTTLLCKKDDCCLNHSLCYHSSDLQLGRVVASPENPYHLFYIDGTRLMELNLTAQNNMTKQISNLSQIDDAKSVLQLTITKDFNTLTAVTRDENGVIKALLYHTSDLTLSSEARGKQSLLAPPNIESILQLSNDALVGLSLGDKNGEMILMDMVLNRTQKLCTVDNSKNILLASSEQEKHCQVKDAFSSITVDEDYIYAVEGLKKKRMLIIHYLALETWRSPPGKKTSTVTVHAEIDSQDEPNWMEISTITMGTVMSLLIMGAVSYSLFVCMRRHHRSSKRHTINQPQAQSRDIQDIELMEIGPSSSHQQPLNGLSIQQSTNAISSPDIMSDSPRDRPLPPLPSNLVSDTEVEIENYETPLSCVSPINQILPAPPPPCPGPSTTSHNRTLAPPVPLRHIEEHSEHYDSSAHYCDKQQHAEDNPRRRTCSPNPVLDPVILQEALSAVQSTSNQRVSSLTLTNNEVRFDFTPQYVPTPDHEYLTINDR